LFALRLGACYGFDPNWLMQGGRPPDLLECAKFNSGPLSTLIELNVIHSAISGEPGSHPAWDGTQITLSGAATVQAECGNRPSVLRFGGKELERRLKPNDLILISQEANPEAEIHLVRRQRDLYLARLFGAKNGGGSILANLWDWTLRAWDTAWELSGWELSGDRCDARRRLGATLSTH
jgi:hypothetical protein